MAWRLAKSLETMRGQINAIAPNRSKSSDGTIGDEAHASRSSDHNPWVMDGGMGVVTALDITHDPAHGVDAGKIAEALRVHGDKRVKYIIWNKRISNPTVEGGVWRSYGGSNPHTKHVHISVDADKASYDSVAPWNLGEMRPSDSVKLAVDHPLLKIGSTGPDVKILKDALVKQLLAETEFGPLTDALVRAVQKKHGLTADGKVGDYTWDILI